MQVLIDQFKLSAIKKYSVVETYLEFAKPIDVQMLKLFHSKNDDFSNTLKVYLKRFRKSTDLEIIQVLLDAGAKKDHKMISSCNKQVLKYLIFSHKSGP